MTAPFIFITNSRIKEGKLEGFKRYVEELVEVVETNEPRLLAFHVYVNEDGSQVSGVQVHPDAASMAYHMQLLGRKIGEAFEFLESDSVEVYGTPGDVLLDLMRRMADVPVSIKPYPLGGFTRLPATVG